MSPTLISGIDGPLPRRDDPVFLLIYPAEPAARRMICLARHLNRKYNLPGWPMTWDRLHITLHLLCCFGQLTDAWFAEICKALTELAMPPFLAGFDYVHNFGRKTGPLVLRGDEGVTGVAMLRDEIVAATQRLTLLPWRRDFNPHITLNYGLCKVPEQTIDRICWPVGDFALVCSPQGQRHHHVLQRWPLRAASYTNGTAYCTSTLIAEAQASLV